MTRMHVALAATLALVAGCAEGGSQLAGPPDDPRAEAVIVAPELVATVGELGALLPGAIEQVRAHEGSAAASAAVAALMRARASFAARVAAGDAAGAYEWEAQLRLESAARIAGALGSAPFATLYADATRARDQLRLRDGSGSGPLQDRLRLTERLCDAAGAAARAGRMPAAYDYAAQALETAAGWQGPPEWAAAFGSGAGDRLRLRDGSCDADGDGIPDRDRQRAHDGTGPRHGS